MLSFATEFPVEHNHNSSEFLSAVRDWILGSPHTQLTKENLADILDNYGMHREWSVHEPNERIESIGMTTDNEDSAAVRYIKNEGELEWITTIVFSRNRSDSWVGIRVDRESKLPAARLPQAKKPVVVRTLLQKLGGASDGPLTVRQKPFKLKDTDIPLARRLIRGQASCHLPIVYVSCNFQGNYIVDIRNLAEKLEGTAHVVVEPNRQFSLRLKFEVDSQNVYGGTIGIYGPYGGSQRKFFVRSSLDTPDQILKAVVENVQRALTNRRPKARCTWAAVQGTLSRQKYDDLLKDGSVEINAYIDNFDNEIKAKDEQLADAENEIARLEAEIRKYESQNVMGAGLTLKIGREQDLYAGELAGIVHKALKDAAAQAIDDSRRKHVLTDIIEDNTFKSEAHDIRKKIKALLRGSGRINDKTKRGLRKIGFEISEHGKHYKLIFQGDDRYTFALSKSGSDHRAGLNLASDIAKRLF